MNHRIHTLVALVVAMLLSAATALGQRPVNVKWTTEVQTVSATSGIININVLRNSKTDEYEFNSFTYSDRSCDWRYYQSNNRSNHYRSK